MCRLGLVLESAEETRRSLRSSSRPPVHDTVDPFTAACHPAGAVAETTAIPGGAVTESDGGGMGRALVGSRERDRGLDTVLDERRRDGHVCAHDRGHGERKHGGDDDPPHGRPR